MIKDLIYVVEDDTAIMALLKTHLGKTYDVRGVTNFRAIQQEVNELAPDLILMDITLPYFNGFYWTTEIRKTSTVPIIFISSSDDEMNMVMALDMGGDDYIAKPFSLSLLDAKIAAFLRRARQFTKDELSFNGFTLTHDGLLQSSEASVQLTPTETKILTTLFQQKEQVVSKDVLLERLWESDEFIDQNTLNVNMTRLRKKVQQLGFEFIHTVRGIGYLLK